MAPGVHARINWRHQYDPARDDAEGERVAIDTGTESLVQQSHAEDADINVIVRRFGLLGTMPPEVPYDPRHYGDMGDVPDLGSALRVVREANERFLALPPDLRFRFGNDPAKLWDFVNDARNTDAAVELGLLKRREEPVITPAPPVAEPTS